MGGVGGGKKKVECKMRAGAPRSLRACCIHFFLHWHLGQWVGGEGGKENKSGGGGGGARGSFHRKELIWSQDGFELKTSSKKNAFFLQGWGGDTLRCDATR